MVVFSAAIQAEISERKSAEQKVNSVDTASALALARAKHLGTDSTPAEPVSNLAVILRRAAEEKGGGPSIGLGHTESLALEQVAKLFSPPKKVSQPTGLMRVALGGRVNGQDYLNIDPDNLK